MYTDNIMVIVTDLTLYIPALIEELKKYGEVLGFKINATRFQIFNISTSDDQVAWLKAKFPFQWMAKSMNYLGMHIAT